MKILTTLWFVTVIASLLICTGCIVDEYNNTIPDGIYVDSKSIESITVKKNSISIKMYYKNESQNADGVYERDYYKIRSIDDNGKIFFSGSSNDSFFVFGILRYQWIFDGKTITKIDDFGHKIIFRMQPAADK